MPENALQNGSLHTLLLTLANEMTPEEQKQMTSLLLREGITGLLQRAENRFATHFPAYLRFPLPGARCG